MESSVLVKGFAILEAMARRPQGWPLGELAAEIDASKPTTRRVLRSLVGLGYVDRAPGGIYCHTDRVHRLAEVGAEDRLRTAAEPVLRALYRQTGETVNLGVLDQGGVRYLRVIESFRPLRHVTQQHTTDPAHTTALGLAILAHLPSEQRRTVLSAGLERRTSRTVTDPNRLARLLDEVAHRGYAIDDEQTDTGVTCIGAAVLDRGMPVAAISVSAPSARLSPASRSRIAKQVRRAAARLSAFMGRAARAPANTKQEPKRAPRTSRTRSTPIRRALRAGVQDAGHRRL